MRWGELVFDCLGHPVLIIHVRKHVPKLGGLSLGKQVVQLLCGCCAQLLCISN